MLYSNFLLPSSKNKNKGVGETDFSDLTNVNINSFSSNANSTQIGHTKHLCTYKCHMKKKLLTDLLTPCTRVNLQKLTSSQPVKIFPTF